MSPNEVLLSTCVSAGATAATAAVPATAPASAAAMPIPDHRSRQATVQELDSADLVIALAREHVLWMRRVHPKAAPRTATLKRLARDLPNDGSPLVDRLARMRLHEVEIAPDEDVLDPAGGDLDVFLDCAREIADLLHVVIPRL